MSCYILEVYQTSTTNEVDRRSRLVRFWSFGWWSTMKELRGNYLSSVLL
jgi:hypothetical protein